MSALAQPQIASADHGRRPSVLGVAWSIVVGGVKAAVVLWIVWLGLELVPLMPSSNDKSMWLPWRIDGIWALVGAIGWGYLACRLTGAYVASSLERRGFARPAVEWVAVAVAISGCAGLALGRSGGGQIVWAIALGAIMVRLLAFEAAGAARRWRWSPRGRIEAAVAAVAALLAITYGATHAFSVTGTGGTYGASPVQVRVGQTQEMDMALSRMRWPASIQSVAVTGPGSSRARIRLTVLSLDNLPLSLATPSRARRMPAAWRQGLVTSSTHLPFRVPAGRYLWISVLASLRNCSTATLNTLKLRYTVLGIATSASMPISSPLTLTCSG